MYDKSAASEKELTGLRFFFFLRDTSQKKISLNSPSQRGVKAIVKKASQRKKESKNKSVQVCGAWGDCDSTENVESAAVDHLTSFRSPPKRTINQKKKRQ